jgi:hypothetical protein
MSEEQGLMWWGYLHLDGSIQLKRWFGDPRDYTTDCEGNDFVVKVVKPFRCDTADKARMYLRGVLSGDLTEVK